MKNTLTILSAAALFSLTLGGCSKEEVTGGEEIRPANFKVEGVYDTPQNDTKTSIDPQTGKVSWDATDRCGAFIAGNSLSNILLTTSQAEPGIFQGTVDESLAGGEAMWAYYPYDADAVITDSELSATIPAAQEMTDAPYGKYALMTSTAGVLVKNNDGSFEAGTVSFRHHTAGYLFNVYGSLREASTNPENLLSVSIETSTPLAGSVTIAGDGTADFGAAAEKSVTASCMLPLKYTKENGAKVFMTVLPNAAHNITKITVETDQGIYTKTVDITKQTVAGSVYPINLNLNTFVIVKKNTLGVPGVHNEWNTSDGITGRTAGFFSGMVNFGGKYKYFSDDWIGSSSEPNTLYYILAKGGGSEFNITGQYYVIADIVGYNASLVNAVTMPGTWNWDVTTAPAFTYDADRDLWVLTKFAMSEGQEFKIAFNETWVNMMNRSIKGGGTISPNTPVHIEYDADKNIIVGASGTYDILLDLSTYGGTIVLEPVAAE